MERGREPRAGENVFFIFPYSFTFRSRGGLRRAPTPRLCPPARNIFFLLSPDSFSDNIPSRKNNKTNRKTTIFSHYVAARRPVLSSTRSRLSPSFQPTTKAVPSSKSALNLCERRRLPTLPLRAYNNSTINLICVGRVKSVRPSDGR